MFFAFSDKSNDQLPRETADIPTQPLLGLPFESPLATSVFDPSVAAKKSLHGNMLFTRSDIFMRNPESGSATLRPIPMLALFAMTYKAYRIMFKLTALNRLLDFPTDYTAHRVDFCSND
ncbi:hypothetical protein IW146_008034, partial [Coemansia sp. RSA 922]